VSLASQQQAVWDDIRTLASPFLAADKLLLAVPLWNFGIPYRLKQLIDLISQKDILFSLDGSGFRGLLKTRKAAVVYARGLDYLSAGSSTSAANYDFQRPYMEMWLRFIGVTKPDVESMPAERSQEALLSRRDRMIVAWQFTAWNLSKKGPVP